MSNLITFCSKGILGKEVLVVGIGKEERLQSGYKIIIIIINTYDF